MNHTPILNWSPFLISGLVTLLYGILALLLPADLLQTVMTVMGIVLMVAGVVCAAVSLLRKKNMMPWMLLLFEAIVLILVGVAAIVWSYETVKLLIILIGIWVAIIGLMQLISLIGIKGLSNKWFFVVCGVLALAFGLLMIFNPFESAEFFVKLTGAIALVVGILTLMFAFIVRREQHKIDKQLNKRQKDDSDLIEDAEIVE
ncbi:MAG: DUF308 domain-containing protein [Bacteroidales bacterium]|nr:DUF308 domain-containing protein [Bacteroidales bacterium]